MVSDVGRSVARDIVAECSHHDDADRLGLALDKRSVLEDLVPVRSSLME